MGIWRKMVAALAAIPMMLALVPAATAADDTAAVGANDSGKAPESSVAADSDTTDAAGDQAPYGYLMVHFIENNAGYAEKVYLDISKGDNPEQWDPLNGGEPILASNESTTGVRDPYITYSPESGKYYILGTDLRVFGGECSSCWSNYQYSYSTKMLVWSSTDLIHWTKEQSLETAKDANGDAITGMKDSITGKTTDQYGMLWAPEATWVPNFYDLDDDGKLNGSDKDNPQNQQGGAFVMYWTGRTKYDGREAKRVLWASTKDFSQGSYQYGGVFVDSDNGKQVLDTTMLQKGTDADGGKRTYRITKGDASGIYMESTDSAAWWKATDWKVDQTKIGSQFGNVEGPAAFADHNADRWYLYVDQIPGGYKPMVSTDLDGATPWSALDSSDFFMTAHTKHGGIISLTRSQYDAIRASDAKPADNKDLKAQATVDVNATAEQIKAALPSTQKVKLAGGGTADRAVTWDAKALAAVDTAKAGSYTVTGTVDTIGANTNHWSYVVDGKTYRDDDATYLNTGKQNAWYRSGGWNGGDATRTPVSSTAISVTATVTVAPAVEPSSLITVKDTDQVLSQKDTVADDGTGAVTKSIVLDYWSDAKTGAKSDKSKISFDYEISDGVTVADESGKTLAASDLDKITDYSTPLKLKVSTGGRTMDYTIGVQVLDTPIRVSGDDAKRLGISATDPTGAEGWKFFADPQVVADGGKYYIFPTTDGYYNWQGHEIHVFESSDLVNWEDKGLVVDLSKEHNDMVDGRKEKAWAPGFAKRDGKYYLYFSGNGKVTVAVSDPAKGGTITSGYKIVKTKVASSIDPAIFEDPATGTWWIAWGNTGAQLAQLDDDMTSVKDGTTVSMNKNAPGYAEAPYITARQWNGKWTYYYSYSYAARGGTSGEDYVVRYSTASSMDGPWTYRGQVTFKDVEKGILGPGHHSILQVPGTDEWYIVYHVFLNDEMRPRGYDATHGGKQLVNGNKREVRISRMTYTEPTQAQTDAGEVPLIKAVPVTYEGVLPETTPSVSVTGAVAGSGDSADAATPVGTKLTAAFNDGWKISSVQWYRADSADAADIAKAVKIDGATAAEYTLTDADAGKTVFAKAIGENTTGVLQNAQPGTAGASPSKTFELISADMVKVAAKPATVPVESVTITGDGVKDGKMTLKEGASAQLKVMIAPVDAKPDIVWSTADAAVATIDVNGKVTGVKAGTTTVTATAKNGVSGSLRITVKAKDSGDNGGDAGDNGGDGNGTTGNNANGTGSATKPNGDGAGLSATGTAVFGVFGVVALLAVAGIGLTIWRKRQA